MPILIINNSISFSLFLDFDMKKDIDSLIAEERVEIIAKYDKVSVCTGMPSPDHDKHHIFITIKINQQVNKLS